MGDLSPAQRLRVDLKGLKRREAMADASAIDAPAAGVFLVFLGLPAIIFRMARVRDIEKRRRPLVRHPQR